MPNKVVLLRPPGDDAPIARLAPYAAETTARGGRVTLYLCEDFACRAPTHDVELVLSALTREPDED